MIFVSLHSLYNNGISAEGGIAIAECLKVNQNLTTLKWVQVLFALDDFLLKFIDQLLDL